jgi:ABC-2 type transport system permease protein
VPLLLGSSVALAPAVWVLVGFAVALFGLVPRAAPAAWGLLGACFLLLYLAPLSGSAAGTCPSPSRSPRR